MPIKRLTVCSVLAAALLVMAPLQATTSKRHGKAPATHVRHHAPVHAKAKHHVSKHARHGKLAASHKSAAHARKLASATPAGRSPEIALTTALPSFGLLGATAATAEQSTPLLTLQPVHPAPLFHPTPLLAHAVSPANAWSLLASPELAASAVHDQAADQADDDELSPVMESAQSVTDLRKALIAMAMKLRDIRYVRGGSDPSTGFDCSGFVRYVFAHAVGMQLPNNSASQFLAGLKVKRADMKPGDLVFFRTHGKRRISHVGIYISNGRFIHSPTTGKSVEISSLDSGYWAKRFAGAKRPEAMAQVAGKG